MTAITMSYYTLLAQTKTEQNLFSLNLSLNTSHSICSLDSLKIFNVNLEKSFLLADR